MEPSISNTATPKKIAIWSNPHQVRTVSATSFKKSMGANRVAEKLFWRQWRARVTVNLHLWGIKELWVVCAGKRHRIIHHKPMLSLPIHLMKREARSADIKFILHKWTSGISSRSPKRWEDRGIITIKILLMRCLRDLHCQDPKPQPFQMISTLEEFTLRSLRPPLSNQIRGLWIETCNHNTFQVC